MVPETVNGGKPKKRKRVAWGITGSGDRLTETIDVVKQLKKQYQDDVRITVYLSKAGNKLFTSMDLSKISRRYGLKSTPTSQLWQFSFRAEKSSSC